MLVCTILRVKDTQAYFRDTSGSVPVKLKSFSRVLLFATP